MSNLQLRIISALVLVAITLPALIFGGFFFAFVATIFCCFVWYEWLAMNVPGHDDRALLINAGFLALTAIALVAFSGSLAIGLAVALWMIGSYAAVLLGLGRPGLSGYTYCWAALTALIHLRGDGDNGAGFAVVVFVVLLVCFTDIAAYFVGRAIGGPKLAPKISPGKTISGAIGGLIGAIIATIISRFLFEPSMAAIGMFALAVVASTSSQLGDLYESSLKRKAGVKDSSAIIPGHGGFMDRLDGMVFAAVVVWVASVAISGVETPATALFWDQNF
ncbi:MAG: phosphatidate cytidylyltransferase [Pseudomonadota bacterium]